MKLLVIARRLHVDRSSEGICSSKFVLALARAGIDLVCLTQDDVGPGTTSREAFSVPWIPGVRFFHTRAFAGGTSIVHRVHEWAAGRPGTPAVAARKADSGLFHLTGHRLHTHRGIDTWQRAVRGLIDSEAVSAILVRGEGTAFDPHIALSRLKPRVPWIAHYHDPYPLSLYPEPFRTVLPLASRRQERQHASVLRHSHALTFPSRRLMEWVLQGRFARHRGKAFILPHLASDLPDTGHAPTFSGVEPGTFALVHTGALLGPRSPVGLIDGFRRFIGDDPIRREHARLILAGPIHRAHSSDSAWTALVDDANVRCIDARVRYGESLALARHASVNVVIEATGATTSPFLPAKFADYVFLQRPILALSIRESAVADALGPDSPFVVPPDDSAAIAVAIERLWLAWKSGRTEEGVAAPDVRRALSESAVLDELGRALRFVQGDTQASRSRTAAAASPGRAVEGGP